MVLPKQVNLERERTAEMSKRVVNLEKLLSESQSRCKLIEDEFMEFRRQARVTSEAQLQSKISQLEAQKTELQGQLDRERSALTNERRAKETIKIQLIRMANELKRIQKEKNQVMNTSTY